MDTPEALAKAIVQAANPLTATPEWQHALERGILTALRAVEAAAYERAAQAIETELDSGYTRSGILGRLSRVLNFPHEQRLAHIDAIKFHLAAAIRALK